MDKHNTARISRILSALVSLFFVVVAVAGFQKTGDSMLALLFLGLAVAGYFIVKLLFIGVNRLLDSLENKQR